MQISDYTSRTIEIDVPTAGKNIGTGSSYVTLQARWLQGRGHIRWNHTYVAFAVVNGSEFY